MKRQPAKPTGDVLKLRNDANSNRADSWRQVHDDPLMPRFQDQIGQDLVAENPATPGSLIRKLRAG